MAGDALRIELAGRIERDQATGEPSGTLREAAVGLVGRLVPKPGPAEYRAGLDYAVERFTELGIVGAYEADASPEMLDAYLAADREDRLTLRVRASQHVDPERGVDQIADLAKRREAYRGRRLDVGAAKLFLDGVIEAKTAALLEPYLGSRDAGDANYDSGRLDALVQQISECGSGSRCYSPRPGGGAGDGRSGSLLS